MKEFEGLEPDQNASGDIIAFEKGFRGLFRGYEGFERMVRFSRYPNITVYPIAVYRNIKGGVPASDENNLTAA